MLNRLKKGNEGFTIIEVLIVLAIAGLILLVVFLAVPSLQRNSRNTQRKEEAAALGGAYSEYSNNRGGRAPAAAADVTNNATLNFYNAANVTLATLANGTAALPAAPDVDSLVVVVNAKCDPTVDYTTNQGDSSVTYSSRGGVILYTVEAAGTPVTACISAG